MHMHSGLHPAHSKDTLAHAKALQRQAGQRRKTQRSAQKPKTLLYVRAVECQLKNDPQRGGLPAACGYHHAAPHRDYSLLGSGLPLSYLQERCLLVQCVRFSIRSRSPGTLRQRRRLAHALKEWMLQGLFCCWSILSILL